MAKKTHRFNTIKIAPNVERDTILNADPVYIDNVRQLKNNITNGIVPKEMWPRIQPSLAMAALRRAGLNMRRSVELLAA
jgi:hypothetical protein